MSSNQHRNLTGSALHNPKGFDSADGSTYLTKDSNGSIYFAKVLRLPNALNVVSGQSAPPTEVSGDVYLIDTTGTAYDIDTITWQSGNTIRYTFNGSPDLSAIAADDYFVTSGNTNSSNDGVFVISAVNDGSDYIEITNVNRDDNTDDEATDAIGTGYYTLAEWDGVQKNSHARFDGNDWVILSPNNGDTCFDETSAELLIFNGTTWNDILASSGDVSQSGTSSDNQIAVFTADKTIEGNSDFTFDSTLNTFNINQFGTGSLNVSLGIAKMQMDSNPSTWQSYTHDSTTNTSLLELIRSRGTAASPSAVQSGDALGRANFKGYNTSSYIVGGLMEFNATETWSGSAQGTEFKVQTILTGATSLADRIVVDGSGDITLGNYKFDGDQTVGAGQDNYVLTYDNATGLITLEASAGGGLADIVDDTTPQLGGSLDVNGNKIVSVSNGNIDIEPNGTGNVLLGNFTFDADQTVGAGQDNYVLTYDHGTGLISLEASAGGGGSSLWTDNSDYISDTNHQFVEITSSSGNTYNATKNFTVGNLLIGDSNTIGGNNIRGTLMNGELLNVGGSGAVTDGFVSGRSNTYQAGIYSMIQGQSNILNGDVSAVIGFSSNVYGDKSYSIGDNNDIGTSGARADFSYTFGKNVKTKSDYQMAIGYGVSQNYNTKPYIGFGLVATASGTQQPTAGFGIDPAGSSTAAINFAMGGQNAFEDGIGINQNGAGNGIFYFHNYNNTRTVEPTTNIGNASAIWGRERAAGKMAVKFKSEDGTNHYLGDFSAIGGDETDANVNKTLTVVGTGTGSGTSSLLCEDSGGTANFEVRDDGVIIMASLPTSSAGLPTGALWNNSGVLNIV